MANVIDDKKLEYIDYLTGTKNMADSFREMFYESEREAKDKDGVVDLNEFSETESIEDVKRALDAQLDAEAAEDFQDILFDEEEKYNITKIRLSSIPEKYDLLSEEDKFIVDNLIERLSRNKK